ncbi:MAG: hypothetical protein ACRD0P_23900, partial [Stackebrandtia sp.]
MLLGGAFAVLAVLGVALYFLVFAGSSAEPAPLPVPTKAVPAPSAPAVGAPAVPAETTPKKLDPNFGDPFKPLIVPAAEGSAVTGGAGSAPATGSTQPSTGGSTQPSTGSSTQGSGSTAPSTGGSGSTAGTPTQTGNAAPLPSKAYRVQVVKVAPGNTSITVKVNDKTYTKKAGQVFATYFKVIFIGGNENAFQFGD